MRGGVDMSHGKGSIPYRKVDKILRKNGYKMTRFNGHYIYENIDGNQISIPRTCCTYLVQRVFKENNVSY